MTKKELFAEVSNICEAYNIPEEAAAKLKALVEPKRAGIKVDINDIACFDEEGMPVYIFDSIFKKWVPVQDSEGNPNFYEKPDTELGWSRFSRAAEAAKKRAEKQFKATKESVLADLLEGTIDQAEAKRILEEAEVARKTYEVPEDLGALDERPCE